jgi:hypothetical protein
MGLKTSRLEAGFIEGEPEKAFLEEAQRILSDPRPPSADSSAVADRKRLMEFIALATDYLRRIGGSERLFHKLMTYYGGLRDLDFGVTAPFLKCQKVHNAPPQSSEIWRLRATLAVALDYLVRAGEPVDDAARTVGRTKGIERLLSGRAKVVTETNAASSVKKWRGDLMRGSVKSDMAQRVWRASREELALLRKAQGFKDDAKRLIAQVRNELVP